MAYLGRGSFPSMGNKNTQNGNSNNFNENRNSYYRRPYYCCGVHYYVPLDNTYVLMQMILTFIILITGFVTFIVAYKSSIVDPIENTKKLFIKVHLIIIAIFLGITFLINYLSKNKTILKERLIVFSIISIITMLIFFGIRLNLDKKYTKEKFEEIYSEQNIEDESDKKDVTKQKVDVGITGVSLKTEKEYYVDECMKLYGIFKTKTYAMLGLHLLLNILLIYQVRKISKLCAKKDQISKDDAIVYDEEQNVKI